MAKGILKHFNNAANQTGVDRNLLLAVASRESGMGMTLDANYLGDGGNGIGLMQVDRRYHAGYAASHAPSDHEANIMYAAKLLASDLRRFDGNMKYALVAYNAGADDVYTAIENRVDPDLFTTGQDYASDVISRYKVINALGGANERPEEELVALLGLTTLSVLTGIAYLVTSKRKQE